MTLDVTLTNIRELITQSDNLIHMKNDVLKLTDIIEATNSEAIQDSYNGKKAENINILSDIQDHADPEKLNIITQDIVKNHITAWLDANLPRIVNDIVEQQIKIIINQSNDKQG